MPFRHHGGQCGADHGALDELEFPQQLIVNLRQETFEAYLREREARIGSR